jgi:hypothetical protein
MLFLNHKNYNFTHLLLKEFKIFTYIDIKFFQQVIIFVYQI